MDMRERAGRRADARPGYGNIPQVGTCASAPDHRAANDIADRITTILEHAQRMVTKPEDDMHGTCRQHQLAAGGRARHPCPISRPKQIDERP
jgi:hypothetical protein